IAADLQSGRGVCELHRARGIRSDPAAATVDRGIAVDRCRAAATSWVGFRNRARPWSRSLDYLSAGARALLYRFAAFLRIFHTRPALADTRARLAIHARYELHGSGGGLLVLEPRNADTDLPWN